MLTPPTPTPSHPVPLCPAVCALVPRERRDRCGSRAHHQVAPPGALTFAVRFWARVAAHETGRAVRGGRGARRRAGGGGQTFVRGGVVQGPVAGERRGRRLVLVQAAPQPRRIQAERPRGRGPRARVQRRAQPVQGAPAAVGHLREGAAAHRQPFSLLPGGAGSRFHPVNGQEPPRGGTDSWVLQTPGRGVAGQ